MASYAGSGKDTLADFIREEAKRYGKNIQKISLGKEVHKITDEYFPFSNKHITRRSAMQFIGEEFRVFFGNDIWIKKLEREKELLEEKSGDKINIVVPDVRKLTDFSHFFIEKEYDAIYLKADVNTAERRLVKRDQEFDKKEIKNSIIEQQLNFIESLPTRSIKNSKLKFVNIDNSPLNKIAIMDNNGGLTDLQKQLEDWEGIVWQKK
ncbi:hypothetical protein FC92_GL001103 [Liquorilactobacillus hordei DSM 19519]|uniref:Uncharacterized protein n=2 Tax=Liquorilactobacillus hordei TaxID=468911 RepID=A0A0R1MJC3_9LACO|nr:hypothetical protein FC92_GL001103 [Liquorilactobacillus hordei DSM 19519]